MPDTFSKLPSEPEITGGGIVGAAEAERLREARELLEKSGYRVSEKPVEWKTFTAVVTMKIQTADLSERDFVRFVSECMATVDVEQVLGKTFPNIRMLNFGKLTVKKQSPTRRVARNENDF